MAFYLYDNVAETFEVSAGATSGPLLLLGAAGTDKKSFSGAGYVNTNTFLGFAWNDDGSKYMAFIGTYNSGDTITVTTPLRGSNGVSAVSWDAPPAVMNLVVGLSGISVEELVNTNPLGTIPGFAFRYSATGWSFIPAPLTPAAGGTGLGSGETTNGGLLLGHDDTTLTAMDRPTEGQILVGQTTGDPSLVDVSGDISLAADGSTTVDSVQNNAVGENAIQNGAVTEDKIGTDAVTVNKIADGSVTASKLDSNIWTSGEVDNVGTYVTTSDTNWQTVAQVTTDDTGGWLNFIIQWTATTSAGLVLNYRIRRDSDNAIMVLSSLWSSTSGSSSGEPYSYFFAASENTGADDTYYFECQRSSGGASTATLNYVIFQSLVARSNA